MSEKVNKFDGNHGYMMKFHHKIGKYISVQVVCFEPWLKTYNIISSSKEDNDIVLQLRYGCLPLDEHVDLNVEE